MIKRRLAMRGPTSGELRDELLVEIAKGVRILLNHVGGSGPTKQASRLNVVVNQFQSKNESES
jgi:hypothetical protein